ncbi:hydrogenase maturation protease [Methyloversatilis thermotolerans]|uniref:hydrogenase maturation protease n=1 Tax=Methyloversatilis thermotolerans TaxID=1346290 RepID=UPI00035F9FDB|nr:hydrogenase maturation protease [Methyloversatilis thermotolerans]
MSAPVAPLLVLGWGNPARADDGLGLMLVDRLAQYAERALPPGRVECLCDFQLQVEHAVDLAGRERVLFVDAAHGLAQPFAVSTVRPQRERHFTTHALSPEALLQVYVDVQRAAPPACTLLALRGRHWTLGEAPDAQALDDLARAQVWAERWLQGEVSPAAPPPGANP